MYRFLLKESIEDPQNIVIKDKEIFHKLTKVLRKQVGDTFFIFDSQAEEYQVKIKEINNKQIICQAVSRTYVDRELKIKINLYLSLLKKDKFEWVLQKTTEIGVNSITPVLTSNCVVTELSKNKIARYQKIIKEATLQSGGKIPPRLNSLLDFENAIKSLDPQNLNLLGHVYDDNKLVEILKSDKNDNINLFIGPEGGFSQDEVNLAIRNFFTLFSLGPRILRAETAAIVACGLVANY